MASLKTKKTILASVPAFSEMSDADLQKMIDYGNQYAVKTGSVIMKEGGPADWLCVLLSGTVEVYVNGKFKREMVGGKAKSFIGESAFFEKGKRTATVVAKTDLRILAFERVVLDKIKAFNAPLACSILTSFVAELLRRQRNDERSS